MFDDRVTAVVDVVCADGGALEVRQARHRRLPQRRQHPEKIDAVEGNHVLQEVLRDATIGRGDPHFCGVCLAVAEPQKRTDAGAPLQIKRPQALAAEQSAAVDAVRGLIPPREGAFVLKRRDRRLDGCPHGRRDDARRRRRVHAWRLLDNLHGPCYLHGMQHKTDLSLRLYFRTNNGQVWGREAFRLRFWVTGQDGGCEKREPANQKMVLPLVRDRKTLRAMERPAGPAGTRAWHKRPLMAIMGKVDREIIMTRARLCVRRQEMVARLRTIPKPIVRRLARLGFRPTEHCGLAQVMSLRGFIAGTPFEARFSLPR